MADRRESVLEADLRAVVDAEEAARLIAEIPFRRLPLKRCVSSKLDLWSGSRSVVGRLINR